MNWEFSPDRPIYAQVLEQLAAAIVSGRYRPGERLPSVRELAEAAAVNPNTVQRAMAELEQCGLAVGYRTTGRFVTGDETVIRSMREQMASEKLKAFDRSMERLGVGYEEAKEMLSKWNEARK